MRVPDVEYGAAGVTEWIVKVGPHFQVWTDEAFRAEFVPQMSIYQPVGER